MPDLEADIWRRFRDRGVLVYGVHGGDDPALLADFVEQTGVTFPVVDGGASILEVDFPVAGYPFPRHVLLDRDRMVRDIRNALDIAELSDSIETLLDE